LELEIEQFEKESSERWRERFPDEYDDETGSISPRSTSGCTPRVGFLTPRKKQQRIYAKEDLKAMLKDRESRRFVLTVPSGDVHMIAEIRDNEDYIQSWIKFDLFFGLLVVANGIMIGIETTLEKGSAAERTLEYIEYVLLLTFIAELILRTKFLGFYQAWISPWNWFDLIVVGVSFIETVLIWANPENEVTGGGFSFLRVMRLFRLLRLVRLIRLFRELYLMVSGMWRAAYTLFWLLMVLTVLIYVFSLLSVEFLGKPFRDPEYAIRWNLSEEVVTQFRSQWGSIGRGMYTLTTMTTYSNWSDTMMSVTKYYPGFAFFFIVYMMVSAFGLMNLVVGIYVTSSMENVKKQEKVQMNADFLTRHRVLSKLREKLMKALELNPGDHLDKKILFAKVVEPEYVNLFTQAGMKLRDIEAVYSELLRAVESCNVEGDVVTLNDFIEGCLWIKGDIVPLDLLYLQGGLKSIRKRVFDIEDAVTKSSATLGKCLKDSMLLMQPYMIPQEPSTLDPSNKGVSRSNIKKKIFNANLTPEEQLALQKERLGDMRSRCWGRFDTSFMILIIANAICIGFQAGNRNEDGKKEFDWNWFIVEWIFWVAFVAEFYLRAVLFTQLRNRQDDTLFWYFCPNIWETDINKEAFYNLRYFFKDPWAWFDLIIIISGGIDNGITLYAKIKYGDSDTDSGGIVILRVLRLFKILRLTRLLHRFKELRLLIQGMAVSMRTLFWAALMILLFVYCGAVFMVEMVGKPNNYNELTDDQILVSKDWSTLGLSMFNLLRIATYDEWSSFVRPIMKEHGAISIALFLFIAITNLGIMNLVVGVMVESAFGVVRKEKEAKRKIALRSAQDALRRAKMMFENTGDSLEDSKYKDCQLGVEQLIDSLKSGPIMPALSNAGLTGDTIKKIFEKLDVNDERTIQLSDFIEGCLRAKQPIQGIDIVSAKLGMRQLFEELIVLKEACQIFEETNKKLVQSLKDLQKVNKDAGKVSGEMKSTYDSIMADNASLREAIEQEKFNAEYGIFN